MSHRHLTDGQIQDYLDDATDIKRERISQHLESCEKCRKKLSIYRQIRAELVRDIDFSLPPTFARDLTNIIGHRTSLPRRILASDITLSVFLFTASIASLYFLVDVKKTFSSLLKLQWPEFGFFASFHTFFSTIVDALNGNLPLLLCAGLILFLFVSLDKIVSFLKYRHLSAS